jgi:hypothetical protein
MYISSDFHFSKPTTTALQHFAQIAPVRAVSPRCAQFFKRRIADATIASLRVKQIMWATQRSHLCV